MNVTKYEKSKRKMTALTLFMIISLFVPGPTAWSMSASISLGHRLPEATLLGQSNTEVQLSELKGRITILSIVPQLNTPVCDEQTHRFSEDIENVEHDVETVTISTNTYADQAVFAEKAGIRNITFLSDAPNFDFGKKTGLLLPMHHILQRVVMVVDEENIIRYIEIVPMSQLPNFAAALDAAKRVLGRKS